MQASKNWKDKEARAKMLRHLKTFSKTASARKENSERTKALWANPVYRAKMVKTRKASYTKERTQRMVATRQVNNPNFVPWNKGKTKKTDARLAQISRRLSGTIPNYNKYRTWYRGKCAAIRMRSRWEVAYAEYLDRECVIWQYEPKKFYVGEGNWTGVNYIPDFYLPKAKEYVEVKGRMSFENRLKLAVFRQLYQDTKLRVLNGTALQALGVVDIHGCAVLAQGVSR